LDDLSSAQAIRTQMQSPSTAARLDEWSEVASCAPLAGLETVHARFRTHRFPAHAHAEYVIGAVVGGAKTTRRGARAYEATQGFLTLFNPYEEHTSWGTGQAWRYAAVYPDADLVAAWFGEGRAPSFARAVVHDPAGARAILDLHSALRDEPDPLAAQSAFVRVTGALMVRHAGLSAPGGDPAPHTIRRLRERLDEDLAAQVGLAELSALARMTPVAVLRAFRDAVGCTPQVYRTARRIAAAKQALLAGRPPVEVAQGVGFCDQSHFARTFRRWTGSTPGAFARAADGAARPA
jgi:AraC-like DNA-binding protein